MKKNILLIAVLLWTGALAFGETGALGFKWKEPQSEKVTPLEVLNKNEYEDYLYEDLKIGRYKKIILRRQKYLLCYYSEETDELNAIAYNLDEEDTKELKRKLKHIFTYTGFNSNFNETFRNYYCKESENLGLSMVTFLVKTCEEIENEGIDSTKLFCLTTKNGETNGEISIYDYNNDTRVYIFENIIGGNPVVVYVPHEQDY